MALAATKTHTIHLSLRLGKIRCKKTAIEALPVGNDEIARNCAITSAFTASTACCSVRLVMCRPYPRSTEMKTATLYARTRNLSNRAVLALNWPQQHGSNAGERGDHATHPGDDNEAIIPSELRPDYGASKHTSENKEASHTKCGDSDSEDERALVHVSHDESPDEGVSGGWGDKWQAKRDAEYISTWLNGDNGLHR